MKTLLFSVTCALAFVVGCKDDVKPDAARPSAVDPSEKPRLTQVPPMLTIVGPGGPSPVASTSAAPSASAAVPSKLDQLLSLDTIERAIALAKPSFTDATDETSAGATLFAQWAAKKMQWKDVALDKDETTFEAALKTPDEARGKRLCAKGLVSKIDEDKGGPVASHSGVLLTGKKDVVHFLAVGPIGDVEAKKSAKLCGVVIGKYDYKNASGEQSHATQVVGLFEAAAAASVGSAAPAAGSAAPATSAAPKK